MQSREDGCSICGHKDTQLLDPREVMEMFHAVQAGKLNRVKTLIDAGINVNIRTNCCGHSLLIPAAGEGHMHIVEYLVNHGADVLAKSACGMTPLMAAAFNGHVDMIKYLLARGVDINAENAGGVTALINAKRRGHKNVVAFLKQQGARG